MSSGEEQASAKAPPYISWQTFLSLVERMEKEGPPPRIDRSYLVGMSGGYQTQVLGALKSLDLIDDDGRVSEELADLATQPEERPAGIRTIFERKYAGAIKLGKVKATHGQLEEEFRKTGLSADPMRKAMSFFLHGSKFAGLDLSPYFRIPKQTVSGGRTGKLRGRRKASQKSNETESGGEVEDEEEEPARLGASRGEEFEIELSDGGKLTLRASVAFMRLPRTDREFLFRLVDQMQEYQEGQEPDQPQGEGGDS